MTTSSLEELYKDREILERSLTLEYSELEHLMSGAFLVEISKELRRLYEEHRVLVTQGFFKDKSGQTITEHSRLRQQESVLHYQICDCEETIELVCNGTRAQQHLQFLTELHAELQVINEKIKCIEQNGSG
jgi:hypothetical protein